MWKFFKHLFNLIIDPKGREYYVDEDGMRRWVSHDGMSTGVGLEDDQTVRNILLDRARYRRVRMSRHKKGEH